MADIDKDELLEKQKKKPYPSLRKLARKADATHAQRERKKK